MEQMKEVGVKPPKRKAPVTGEVMIDPLDMEMYQQKVKSNVHNKDLLQMSMMRIYSVIYRQCSDVIHTNIKTMSKNEKIAKDGNTIGLLKNIKSVMSNLQKTSKPVQYIMNCKKKLLAYRQGRDQTIPENHKKFKGLIDVIEYNGGSVGPKQARI